MPIVSKVTIELEVPKDTVFRDADHDAIVTFLEHKLGINKLSINNMFNIRSVYDTDYPFETISVTLSEKNPNMLIGGFYENED